MFIIDIINSIEDGLKLNLKCSCRLKYVKIFIYSIYTISFYFNMLDSKDTEDVNIVPKISENRLNFSHLFFSLVAFVQFFFLSPFSRFFIYFYSFVFVDCNQSTSFLSLSSSFQIEKNLKIMFLIANFIAFLSFCRKKRESFFSSHSINGARKSERIKIKWGSLNGVIEMGLY
uniref:Uncharacterized protein n=2 Tax=Cacopsylla melanoneura TaxID=428564 RepID=A0A8D8R044_9HEMI